MISIPHWSYSAISQYLRCPLQYYFERVLKLPQPTISSSLVLGSCLHEALSEYHAGLKKNDPWETDSIYSIFELQWQIREDEQKITYRPGEVRDALIAQGKELLKLYLQQPPPKGVSEIEQRGIANLKHDQGTPLGKFLLAFFDLVLEWDDRWRIVEFKTSQQAYSQTQVEMALQATCYLHIWNELHGEPVDLEYVVFVKTKVPKLQRIVTTRSSKDFRRLGNLVALVDRAVNEKLFFPNESPMNCSSCPYRQPCRDWGTSRRMNGSAELITLSREIDHDD
jgi:putative RecB family exonuclease